ncbi:metallopeptidase family protein [Altererythrobacter sp. TH136]|uniref:metallopeptidase family protein n=1 Tax=Altererythrobacter sp. TH136 TaxID=2067415 RepID=UPI001162EC9C|nr:metallopeptidase family protein [Altererythrobacter sp. TH136]QDM41800.1 metallopeptidase family protein [Altererythrobacter sp. TH136]
MTRTFASPPSPDEFERIARAALARLPAPFAEHVGDVVLSVEEFADAETLAQLGIEDPFMLTGLFEGIAMTEQSIEMSGQMPNRVRLFRGAILDEWIAEGEDLEHLISHVVIHEIGHHFGLSDEDMHALEDGAD